MGNSIKWNGLENGEVWPQVLGMHSKMHSGVLLLRSPDFRGASPDRHSLTYHTVLDQASGIFF